MSDPAPYRWIQVWRTRRFPPRWQWAIISADGSTHASGTSHSKAGADFDSYWMLNRLAEKRTIQVVHTGPDPTPVRPLDWDEI